MSKRHRELADTTGDVLAQLFSKTRLQDRSASAAEIRAAIPPHSVPVALHVTGPGKIHVKIIHGDIRKTGVDCIVNAAPDDLAVDKGCAGSLRRAAGDQLDRECKLHIEQHGKLKVGQVAVTDGGNIGCLRIIHAHGPAWSGDEEECKKKLVRTLIKCLTAALDTESVAIPGVSGGRRGVPSKIVGVAMCEAVTVICQAARSKPCKLRYILLTDMNESIVQGFVDAFQKEVKKGTYQEVKAAEATSSSRRGQGFDSKKMRLDVDEGEDLPGYKGCGTITIIYDIPSGVQSANHPNPGKHYHGIQRTTYLPNNERGRNIVSLLEKAFHNDLLFDIGKSKTTGEDGVIVWTGKISHRTNTTGGPKRFGYPDPDYLDKVEKELTAHGITLSGNN